LFSGWFMAFKSQLVNFQYSLSDLNRHIYLKNHLIVPVELPLNSDFNVHKLLAICLLNDQYEEAQSKFLPKYNVLAPDIIYENLTDPMNVPLWVYSHPLNKQDRKKIMHKMARPVCICSTKDLEGTELIGDIELSNNLSKQLTQILAKSLNWYVVVEGDRISVTTNEDYITGKVIINKTLYSVDRKYKQIA